MKIADTKQALRRAVLARRDGLAVAVRKDASAAIVETGLALSARFAPGPVSVFWPIRSEVDTRPLAIGLAERGFDVCLPKITGDHLRFARWRPGERLCQGAFGLQEPCDDATEIEPITLLVPVCAFDRSGHRLGYGKGYYDRTLARMAALEPILAIGIAFSVQEVDSVPAEPHDRRLNAILTESGVLTASNAHRLEAVGNRRPV
jgi:5-formyltetrahydrofolate cyclo-ligase